MKPLPAWFRLLVRVVSLAPPLGAALGWRLFWQLGAPVAVRPSERAFHDSARVTTADGVVVYEWGTGERPVLLVHGWRSRASRWAALGGDLVARGYTVVAFDGRGHGASPGTRTHAYEFVDVIRALGRRYGPFEAVVAHSFGAVPTFMAVRSGVAAKRIATIAGVHDFDSIVRTFAAAVGLGRAATRGLRRHIERWASERDRDVWRHVVAELDPTDTTTPVLVVHDTGDREVPLEQATRIVEAHTGPVDTLITDGLGHNRVLADPAVIDRIAHFVAAPLPFRNSGTSVTETG